MRYTLHAKTPDVATYIDIRLAAGLSRKSEAAARIGLQHGLYSVMAYHGNEPIGIGRIIGDGGCFFQIVDIAVRPEHQKRGVGDLIMGGLMDWLREHAPVTAYISLMADHGTPDFYARYGFEMSLPPKKAGMFLRVA